jgi:hypothetical protein
MNKKIQHIIFRRKYEQFFLFPNFTKTIKKLYQLRFFKPSMILLSVLSVLTVILLKQLKQF